ncbi:MAG: helix-turn-helix domain-containing protein [Lachnospiraceae bacterium]
MDMNMDQPGAVLKNVIADEALFISSSYLSKLFLKETGYKFSTFLTIKRMEKAERLIREKRDATIYEVAETDGIWK